MIRNKIKIKIVQNEFDFELKSILEPNLWEGTVLKEEIRTRLLVIADEFLKFLKINIDPEDITFTGSLANYNYTKYSDIDLHIIFDYDKIDENKELVAGFLMSKKNLWNNKHAIGIKGYEVEIYPQDSKEVHHSTGIYSIKNNNWLVEPKKSVLRPQEISISDIKKKAQEIIDDINNIESSQDKIIEIDRLKDKIRRMRKAGLERGGEYSIENLAFKLLRRMNYLNKLEKIKTKEYDQSFSLNGTIS
jgi:hypothetical protein